jgi:hypothetical protein
MGLCHGLWWNSLGSPYSIETYQQTVFINHRGPDAKLTHASLIYHSLRHCGLRVFLDAKELRMGGSTLYDAIRLSGAISSASVHIVIFSKNYAESRWCLDELCWILRSVQERTATIVPMFCDVEPKNLRDITRGPYAEAFDKHKRKRQSHHGMGGSTEKSRRYFWYTSSKLIKGKNILYYLSHLKLKFFIIGSQFLFFFFFFFISDYGMYLEQIVRTVLTEVKQKSR